MGYQLNISSKEEKKYSYTEPTKNVGSSLSSLEIVSLNIFLPYQRWGMSGIIKVDPKTKNPLLTHQYSKDYAGIIITIN